MLFRSLVAASVLLIPIIHAQPESATETSETSLFFHPANWADSPINTQPITPPQTYLANYGVAAHTVSCASGPVGNTGGAENEYHTYRGYSSPSLVDYSSPDSQGKPRIDGSRGMAYDVMLQPDSQATLHWFFAPPATAGSAWSAPNFRVLASVRATSELSVDNLAYDSAELVMSGSIGPVTLAGGQAIGPTGQPSPNVSSTTVGGRPVYDFAIPMTIASPRLGNVTGFNVRVDAFLDNPACANPQSNGAIMPSIIEPYADAAHAPRLDIRHGPTLQVARHLAAEPVAGTGILFRWSIASAWGAYDVNVADEVVEFMGPTDGAVLARAVFDVPTPAPLYRLEAVQSGWVWDFKGEKPADGTYHVKVKVGNLQGSATTESSTSVRLVNGQLVNGPDREAPALGMPMLLVALAMIGIALRRRN